MTGSGRGDRETAAVEAAAKALQYAYRDGSLAVDVAAAVLAAARPHLRAEVAAEIAEALEGEQRRRFIGGSNESPAEFVRREFVSVRPDNEEAKVDALAKQPSKEQPMKVYIVQEHKDGRVVGVYGNENDARHACRTRSCTVDEHEVQGEIEYDLLHQPPQHG